MIRLIALGLLSFIALPFLLIASPYFLYRYWIPNEILREGSGYKGAWFTYKESMKDILWDVSKLPFDYKKAVESGIITLEEVKE